MWGGGGGGGARVRVRGEGGQLGKSSNLYGLEFDYLPSGHG